MLAHAEMAQFASGVPGDRHHLCDVPLYTDGSISLVNITISQRPDGSDWLLGHGSSGKVAVTISQARCSTTLPIGASYTNLNN